MESDPVCNSALSIVIDSDHGPSNALSPRREVSTHKTVTPEEIRPHLKAVFQKRIYRGRKPGKPQIMTSTPVKKGCITRARSPRKRQV